MICSLRGAAARIFNEPALPWENAAIESFLTALAQAAKNLETYCDVPHEAAQNVALRTWEAVAG